ncbi:MAG: tetratricopeptide repeat protein [Polyangiaceae bacterium]|nr:tetratricopeptide repeat protein [Polyangiaceae bacterium]
MRGQLGALLGALAVTSSAFGTPSLWDKAADPRRARTDHAFVAVERMLVRAEASAFDPALARNFTRAGLALIELAAPDTAEDPRLMLLLGELLIDGAVRRDEDGRKLLLRALDAHPETPMAGRAWFNVAIASARLGEPLAERDAYTRALERVYEPEFRANIYMNRGESRMVLGDLRGAQADFRRAIKLAQRPDLMALAHYGLGIVLERYGDLPSALDAMDVARQIRLGPFGSALDLPSVFFVPSYDIHYYKALAAMAAERSARSTVDKRAALEEAIEHWDAYLGPAVADEHQFLPRAKLHRRRLAERLSQLPADRKRAR